jgi:hypothetical protein
MYSDMGMSSEWQIGYEQGYHKGYILGQRLFLEYLTKQEQLSVRPIIIVASEEIKKRMEAEK